MVSRLTLNIKIGEVSLSIDLVTYCVREKMPFTVFETWSEILAIVKDIVSGKTTVKKVSDKGVEDYKRGGNEKN